MTVNYREAYDLFACNGILFNHESERRGETFVSRKITRAATRIKLGLQDKLYLGNLDAKRDWGYAKDYVEAMWLMLQQETPEDYVIATGETRSIREFLDATFALLDLDWKQYVEIDPRYFRPTEVDLLLGDPSKAKKHARMGTEDVVPGDGRHHGRARPRPRQRRSRPPGPRQHLVREEEPLERVGRLWCHPERQTV